MFEILRMGCACKHDSSFVLDVPQGFEGYLMLFVRTPAFFQIGDTAVTVEPDTFILYDIGTPLRYGASGGDYINDWILFSCTKPLETVSPVRFNELIPVGEQINLPQYFRLIADCYYREAHSQTVGLLIRAMLAEIFSAPAPGSEADLPHYRELLDLRRRIYAQPGKSWSLKGMAQMLNLSMPYLHALYKKAFGVTCMADVIRSRMEQAQHYLRDPGMTIGETAFACGYSSTVHFSRQFKQQLGCSPQSWRRREQIK
ncbi:MAG: helix-turn-helix transcriptional regulator [Oscillospiraceae bacterium]|nr:helix-turn-helix transcriptional regulator [Oscillospiraceae bacterium]